MTAAPPTARPALVVLAPGPFATVQDLGRGGYAHLGVPRSGAADRGSLRLANRLVGNPEGAAAIEVTHGGFAARVIGDVALAATGATAQLFVDGRPVGGSATVLLRDGQTVLLGPPARGCRTYLGVRGGVAAAMVLGSASTDTLSGLGPAALSVDDVVAIGVPVADWPATQSAPVPDADDHAVVLAASPGPRADRLANPEALFTGRWVVNPASNRVGVRLDRLDGPPLRHRPRLSGLPSEGIAHGAIQVPPSGQPVLFGPDHPVTGGYPVIAALTASSIDLTGQLTPGTPVRLRLVD